MANRTPQADKKTIGAWTWNSKLLNEKVVRGRPDECWPATNFAQSQHGPLFGVLKNSHRQMSQVCRILYRDWFNEDCEQKEIAHACGNKNCINPSHWQVLEDKKRGARPKSIKQATMTPIAKNRDFF